MTYKDSGVNIDTGNNLISAIGPIANTTIRSGVNSKLGGFAALFDLKAAGYDDPILVAGTDGVGTKMVIANIMKRHDTIGIDLVAMCVNDLIVQGAEPLFFLDYFATSKLEMDIGLKIIKGIAEGCRLAECALIGGETAEMPGVYSPGDCDLAGFCVGAVERGALIKGDQVLNGDVILGLASDGIHSNGFSLVRSVIDHTGIDYDDPTPFLPQTPLGETLLTPTRIYVKSCLNAIKVGGVRALVHITGGGFIENIPRVLPKDLSAQINGRSWSVPEIFKWLAATGNIDSKEMLRTFNCGIGMILIVEPEMAPLVAQTLKMSGETVFKIGHITAREDNQAVSIDNYGSMW